MELRSLASLDVILASQAPWRSEILHQLRIDHHQANHKFNEPRFTGGSLEQFIAGIAREKAKSLISDYPQSLIIAADQLICLDNEILYKSGSRDKAIEQLEKLNGRKHKLISAVAVWFADQLESEIDSAELKMRKLQPQEIVNYVDYDKPWDCAGSYKIESLGAALFESARVSDPTTIIGLPANKLLTILRKWGYSNLL
jgi:septum formation protein